MVVSCLNENPESRPSVSDMCDTLKSSHVDMNLLSLLGNTEREVMHLKSCMCKFVVFFNEES